MPTYSGSLVTFEGGEGTGKSTQLVLLQDWLRVLGRKIVVTVIEAGIDDGYDNFMRTRGIIQGLPYFPRLRQVYERVVPLQGVILVIGFAHGMAYVVGLGNHHFRLILESVDCPQSVQL